MIAGHLGLAAVVKAWAPKAPLWALTLATLWLDVIFVPLVLLGVEHFEPVAGAESGAYGQLLIFADYTHSLVGALSLSAVFAALTWRRYGRRVASVLGAVSFSHWVLDLVVHRADMPLWPNQALDLPRLGLGLWQYSLFTAALELLLVAAGAFVYWRAARGIAGANVDIIRRADLCGGAIFLGGAATLGANYLGY